MKRYVIAVLFCLLFAMNLQGAILNNSGSSSEDSLSVYLSCLDSLGNPTSADSFFVVVFKSGTNAVVFSDSGTTALTGLDTVTAGGGITHYYYHRAVSDIDGTGATGQYCGVVVAKKNTGNLLTPNSFEFQVVGWELDEFGDSSGIAAISSTSALDSLGIIIDSLNASLDSLQNQYNWVGNMRYSLSDSILKLRGMRIVGTGTNDTAVYLSGTGAGQGLYVLAGTLADGIEVRAGAGGSYPATGNAIDLRSAIGAGLISVGYLDGALFQATNSGGDGIAAFGGGWSGTSGYGFRAEGGRGMGVSTSSSGQPGLYVNSTNGVGIQAIGLNDSDLVAGIVGSLSQPVTTRDTTESGDTIAVMPSHWVAADSTAYQGAANSLTAGQVADAVWDESQSGHSIAGTYGLYLDAKVSGISGGSGAYSYSMHTIDTAATLAVPGASVSVRSIDQSTLLAVSLSNSKGVATFNLDADSFVVIATAPGYLFEPYDTIIVSGAGSDSLKGYSFDPGQPSSPDLCRVYGYVADLRSLPEQSISVSARLPYGVARSGNLVVSPATVSTVTDSLGYFFFDLIPSDSLIGSDVRYELTITRSDGNILRKRFKVPATASWQLAW